MTIFSKGNQESDESFVEHFSEQVETAIHVVLCAIQCLVERKQEQGKEKEKSPEEDGKSVTLAKSDKGKLCTCKTSYACMCSLLVTPDCFILLTGTIHRTC